MRNIRTSLTSIETRNKLDQENWNGYGQERLSLTKRRLDSATIFGDSCHVLLERR